jgi:hypothetical protein
MHTPFCSLWLFIQNIYNYPYGACPFHLQTKDVHGNKGSVHMVKELMQIVFF